jgi:hypothetical protein
MAIQSLPIMLQSKFLTTRDAFAQALDNLLEQHAQLAQLAEAQSAELHKSVITPLLVKVLN